MCRWRQWHMHDAAVKLCIFAFNVSAIGRLVTAPFLESGTDCYPAGSPITSVGLGRSRCLMAVGALHEDHLALQVWWRRLRLTPVFSLNIHVINIYANETLKTWINFNTYVYSRGAGVESTSPGRSSSALAYYIQETPTWARAIYPALHSFPFLCFTVSRYGGLT